VFLVHDINFHRGIAAASGNPIVASLVEMVASLYYERRRTTAERAVDRDVRDAADAHRQIYQAIRAHDVERARRAMHDHLTKSRAYQAKELAGVGVRGSAFGVRGSRSSSSARPKNQNSNQNPNQNPNRNAEPRTPNPEPRRATR